MSARRPAVLTSDAVAEAVAAALWEHAASLPADTSSSAAAAARLCRRTARELLELHGIDANGVLIDRAPVAASPDTEQYR